MRILDSRDKVLRCKTVSLVKVLWQHRGVEEASGNTRTRCRLPILSYLRTKVRSLIFDIRTLLNMHVFMCASMCEFRGRNSIKGGRM